jgi:tetratricopeptide (TPR) repeat protein
MAERCRLSVAATAFEVSWEKAKGGEAGAGEMAIAALHGAMLARQVLGDGEAAVGHARELIACSDDPDLLSNAVQVAFFTGEQGLAAKAINKLGDTAQASFHRAMIHLQRREWVEAAQRFESAEIPDVEKAIAATVIALAPMHVRAAGVDEAAFTPAFTAAHGNPRGLVLVARFAAEHAFPDLAAKAFDQAVGCLGKHSTLMERSMVAAYAAGQRAHAVVIGVLEGWVDEDRVSEELLMLAEAHALEHPLRERNRAFFDRLPAPVRDQGEIASFRASVLMQTGKWAEAEALFRVIRAQHTDDPYALLGLEAVAAADEAAMRGSPAYLMPLAHALKRAGEGDRALRYAYLLMKTAPDNPNVVLGYIALILDDSKDRIVIPEPVQVGAECFVELGNERGETDGFVIDAGPSFFGIEVRSAGHESVKRVMGLACGATVAVAKGPLPPERWTITTVKSKFLHLLHVAMQQFNRKFPGVDGLWSFPSTEDGMVDMFTIIRQTSEANEKRAKIYTEGVLPLAFVAKMMGGDPASFAQYLVDHGNRIVTCMGFAGEFAAAEERAREWRGRGAVLDFYTAWTAAELGILPTLRAWFGRLATPAATIDELDQMIARQEEDHGRGGMTVGWRDGQFYRHEVTDEFVVSQVRALQAIRSAILADCEVVNVLVPNELSDIAVKVLELVGPNSLDPVHLARRQDMTLLSDDLRYREVGMLAAGVGGVWLQVVLAAALAAGIVERAAVTRAYVGLAASKHGHLRLDAVILRDVFDGCPDDDLRAFGTVIDFIGGPHAHMRSHTMVVARFLSHVWNRRFCPLKIRAATGMILTMLLRARTADWFVWLALLLRLVVDNDFHHYVSNWLKGHFLPEKPVVGVLNRLAG